MNIIQTIISYLAIAAAFISSVFSWGDSAMISYTNDYTIPDSIPGYNVISTDEKNDWIAKWIWDKDNLTEENLREMLTFANAAASLSPFAAN